MYLSESYVLKYQDDKNMNKRNVILSMGMALSLGALASPLTPQQALSRLRQDVTPERTRIAAKITAAQPVFTAQTAAGTNTAYIFNASGHGYVIVSADDVAYPLLGYSDSGCIDPSNMSPEMKWWIDGYGRQIEWANEHGFKAAVDKESRNWAPIAPLVKSRWDQGKPYYNECPEQNGSRCVTGCVATSMAQVMNYFKYPEVGTGRIAYNTAGQRVALDLSKRNFDWSNMLDVYTSGEYTDEQASAVAYLMKCCGYSVQMNYTPQASGASGGIISNALVNNFKYDQDCITRLRDPYSSSEWEQMVYDNLKNIGPVVINGASPLDGGHSFVCDGYDGKGYYHFNWGWGGVSDGYFALDALNPEAQGTGGSAGGFNFSQNAIFGIQPPTGQAPTEVPEVLFQYGTTTGTLSGGNLSLHASDYYMTGWGLPTSRPIEVNAGAIFEDESGSQVAVKGKIAGLESLNIETCGSYYPAERFTIDVTMPQLDNGRYKVYAASKPVAGTEWSPVIVPWGCRNYCFVTVNNGNYTVEDIPELTLSLQSFNLASDLYFTKNALIEIDMHNSADIELTNGIQPVLCNAQGQVLYTGNTMNVTLSPGETSKHQLISKFYDKSGSPASGNSDTELHLSLKNYTTGMLYESVDVPVTVKANPGNAQISLAGLSIDNSTPETVHMGDRDFFGVSILPNDTKEIGVNMSFKVKKGFFDGQMIYNITRVTPDNVNQTVSVVDGIYSCYPFTATGETRDVHATLDFEPEPGVIYFVQINYTIGYSVRSLGSKSFMMGTTGILDILGEGTQEAPRYFNLQGMEIENPQSGQVVIERRGSKSNKIVFK